MPNWIKVAPGWLWTNLGNFALLVGWALSFAVPAWAVKTANVFSQYAPASWIAAGFLGLLIGAAVYWIIAAGRARWVRTKYDNAMMLRGGLVDPMAKTFEQKRIFLSEFTLPSHPWIEGKTFIDCEIIGPANVLLVENNNATEGLMPSCDAIVLAEGDRPFNAIFLKACTFRGCSFQRITFLISHEEYEQNRGVNWLHWIGHCPEPQLPFNQVEGPLSPPQQDTE